METSKNSNKQKLLEFNRAVRTSSYSDICSSVKEIYHEQLLWNGPQPFNTLTGSSTLLKTFWIPFINAIPDIQKNDYILFSGNDSSDNREWVVSSGNYCGTFIRDWLDIPATNGAVWIRYVEFSHFADGKIIEVFTLFDILDLMRQAGCRFIPSLAPEIMIPGPATLDGIQIGDSSEKETAKSLQLVYNMVWKGLESFSDKGLENMGMERYWHKDFMWYGPCGIGSTRGISGFQKYHQGPFLKAVPNRHTEEHSENQVFFAEGKYCAYSGWEGLTAAHTGPDWLGMPATNKQIIMRCIDLWRRDGDFLAENWVFLDIIDILLQMGVDIFDRLKNQKYLI